MKKLQQLLAACLIVFMTFSNIINFVLPSQKLVVSALSNDELYLKHKALITDTPSVWVFGEVINNSTKVFRDVKITITFYDNKNELIENVTKNVWLKYILPHRRAPFAGSITEENAKNFINNPGSRYDVRIESYEEESIEIERNLVINIMAASLSDTNATVAFTVFNNGTKPITELNLIAIFYDENGTRCAEGLPIKLYEPLNPGQVTDPLYVSSVFINNNLVKEAICIITGEALTQEDPLHPEQKKYYTTDTETLFWLKGERRIIHYAEVDGEPFYIETYSNSSVHDLMFLKTSRKITFKVSGIVPETKGFCNITIPIKLLNGPYTVKIDDTIALSNYNPLTNGTHNFVYITYNHNSESITVEIIGPQGLDFRIIIAISFIVCIVVIVTFRIHKNRKIRRSKRKRPDKNR